MFRRGRNPLKWSRGGEGGRASPLKSPLPAKNASSLVIFLLLLVLLKLDAENNGALNLKVMLPFCQVAQNLEIYAGLHGWNI